MRRSGHVRKSSLLTAAVFLLGLIPVSGYSQIGAHDPPVRMLVDENGVDLSAGRMSVRSPTISIGTEESSLSYYMHFLGPARRHSFQGGVKSASSSNQNNVTAYIGEHAESFTKVGGTYVSDQLTGASLVQNPSTLAFTYTMRDGTVAVFNRATATTYDYYAYISSLTFPSGERLNWEYLTSFSKSRVARVRSTRGYSLDLTYAESSGLLSGFLKLTNAKLVNLINSAASGMPSLSIVDNPGVVEFTDAAGRVSRIAYYTDVGVYAVKHPGSTNNNILVSYSAGKVFTVNNNGLETGYYSWSPYTYVIRPGLVTEQYTFSGPYRLQSYVDPLNRTTAYTYDGNNRLTKITYPEGNAAHYTYDARGNVTATRFQPKPSSAESDIYLYAGYDATCTNPKTCNKPNWTTDGAGNVTHYSYDSVHGGVVQVTQPSPGSGLPNPRVSYSYAAHEAWYKNSSGVIAPSGAPIYVLTGTSTCRSSNSCIGTADETKVAISYGVASSGRNLWPVAVTTQSGDGLLVSTTTRAYDLVGNLLTSDGPLVGSADTTVYQYDVLRRLVATTYPDPDGSGPAQGSVERTTYDLLGRVASSKFENAGVAHESYYYSYDTANRLVKAQRAVLSGGVPSVTQQSYDAAGRLECVAERMNPVASLPASACTHSALDVAYGPDRITNYVYDAAGQIISETAAFGVSGQQRTVQSRTYSPNGKPLSETDGNGNKTTYEYDGFDRLVRTWFPDKTVLGQSSSSDFEQTIYLGEHPHQVRNRDGSWYQFSFDALGRMVIIDRPGTTAEDIYYSYDNHGRLLAATYGSSAGPGTTYTYDALGRNTSKSSFGRTLYYQYNLADQVERLTHPDGFYVTYSYGVTGRLESISDSGGNPLVAMTYDPLDRLTGIQRNPVGGGAYTGVAYDSWFPWRVGGMVSNLAGADYDSVTSYTYNPAGQLRTKQIDNDVPYSWRGHYNQVVGYVNNGLNQVTQVGSGATSYDPLGNLVADATFTFAYDVDNQLRSATSSANTVSLLYDPDGMLRRVDQSAGATTEFLYDRGNLVAEYDGSGALLRRYVHGNGIDQPMVWFEGPGASDVRWFHADERGSIVAVSDAAGSALYAYSYSPYGEPNSTIGSRFLYTGQPFIRELGLQYSKSRFYSAKLGRFLQPDPIGYEAGMNVYSYVSGDPINNVDPWGLEECSIYSNHQLCPVPTPLDIVEELTEVHVTATRLKEDSARSMGSYVIEGVGYALIFIDIANSATIVFAGPDVGILGSAMIAGVRTKSLVTAARAAPKSWSAARRAYWKANGPGGKAPRREVLVRDTRTGQVYRRTETKELDHIVPQRAGGGHDASNLREVWPTEHAAIDPYRHTGYEVIRVLSGP